MQQKIKNENELGIAHFWRFTDQAIETAPDKPGVFAFFDDHGVLVLMGSTVKSLRNALRTHWCGYEGGHTCGASYVGFEVAERPLEREAELAEQYQSRHGRKPRRQAS